MNLYTDDNPNTTLKGLGFKNKKVALNTIKLVENYFNKMLESQKIPGYTPDTVLPRFYISNHHEAKHYYEKQKMYRILGMMNRAKGMLLRVSETKRKNFNEAIQVFQSWMSKYKKTQ